LSELGSDYSGSSEHSTNILFQQYVSTRGEIAEVMENEEQTQAENSLAKQTQAENSLATYVIQYLLPSLVKFF
jgi:hypothetical protein